MGCLFTARDLRKKGQALVARSLPGDEAKCTGRLVSLPDDGEKGVGLCVCFKFYNVLCIPCVLFG